jgi:hypothetical protein
MVCATCANSPITDQRSTKPFLTTKLTKDTKHSEIGYRRHGVLCIRTGNRRGLPLQNCRRNSLRFLRLIFFPSCSSCLRGENYLFFFGCGWPRCVLRGVSYRCPVDSFDYHRVRAHGQFGRRNCRIEDKSGPLTWKRAGAYSVGFSCTAFLPAMKPWVVQRPKPC